MFKVSRQQIEAQIALLKEKVALQERFCHAIKARGTTERQFIQMLQMLAIGIESAAKERIDSSGRTLTDAYLAAHKAHYQAQADAADIALAEMKSQLAISEAMLKEALDPSPILSAGGIVKAH